jgi:hypothetical protein
MSNKHSNPYAATGVDLSLPEKKYTDGRIFMLSFFIAFMDGILLLFFNYAMPDSYAGELPLFGLMAVIEAIALVLSAIWHRKKNLQYRISASFTSTSLMYLKLACVVLLSFLTLYWSYAIFVLMFYCSVSFWFNWRILRP